MKITEAVGDSTYRPPMISTGFGRTTCSYYLPDGNMLYASTHESSAQCPEVTVTKGKYLWPVYDSYDIYIADRNGTILKKLTDTPGYDAEATVSPQGDKIVFTSMRSGDLELWTMKVDGSEKKQVTSGLGYDGGAFFSPDGKMLVFRSSRPETEEEIREYKDLLSRGLVAPTDMEIYVCNVDGTGLEQVTVQSPFNAFPVFSPDGKMLVFSSNRNNGGGHDTNVFIADWKE